MFYHDVFFTKVEGEKWRGRPGIVDLPRYSLMGTILLHPFRVLFLGWLMQKIRIMQRMQGIACLWL